jgi:hypothetical protein
MTTDLSDAVRDTQNVTNFATRSLVVRNVLQAVWQFGWVWSLQRKYQWRGTLRNLLR